MIKHLVNTFPAARCTVRFRVRSPFGKRLCTNRGLLGRPGSAVSLCSSGTAVDHPRQCNRVESRLVLLFSVFSTGTPLEFSINPAAVLVVDSHLVASLLRAA